MRRFTPYSRINFKTNYSGEKGMISNANNFAVWRFVEVDVVASQCG
jgi:hypothetical protein